MFEQMKNSLKSIDFRPHFPGNLVSAPSRPAQRRVHEKTPRSKLSAGICAFAPGSFRQIKLSALMLIALVPNLYAVPVTEADVIALLEAGVTEADLVKEILANGYTGEVNGDGLGRLRNAGASAALLLAARKANEDLDGTAKGRAKTLPNGGDMSALEAQSMKPLFLASRSVDNSRKIGFIDQLGKIAIKFQFDEAKSFSEGLAAVKSNGKWGYINKLGALPKTTFSRLEGVTFVAVA